MLSAFEFTRGGADIKSCRIVCLRLPTCAGTQAYRAARRHLGEALSAFEFFDEAALGVALDHVHGLQHPIPDKPVGGSNWKDHTYPTADGSALDHVTGLQHPIPNSRWVIIAYLLTCGPGGHFTVRVPHFHASAQSERFNYREARLSEPASQTPHLGHFHIEQP